MLNFFHDIISFFILKQSVGKCLVMAFSYILLLCLSFQNSFSCYSVLINILSWYFLLKNLSALMFLNLEYRMLMFDKQISESNQSLILIQLNLSARRFLQSSTTSLFVGRAKITLEWILPIQTLRELVKLHNLGLNTYLYCQSCKVLSKIICTLWKHPQSYTDQWGQKGFSLVGYWRNI